MRLALALALSLAPAPVFAQATTFGDWTQHATVIGGQASGVWIPEDSPYWVVADTDVKDLVVLAGVEVRAWPGVRITVHGSLLVQGTQAEPVLFGAHFGGTRWSGLALQQTTGANDLAYLRVERAANSGLTIQDSPATLTNCTLLDNRAPTKGGGLRAACATDDLTLIECVIANNATVEAGGGLSVFLGSGQLSMLECRITANSAVGLQGTWPTTHGGGLDVEGAGAVVLTDCRFSSNQVSSPSGLGVGIAEGGGLRVSGADLTMTRCLIDDNTAFGSGSPSNFYGSAVGAGAYLALGASSGSLDNCIFAGNFSFSDATDFDNTAGLQVSTGSVTLTNSIIARNHARIGQNWSARNGTGSSGLGSSNASVAVRNSIVYGNTLSGFWSQWIPPAQHEVVGLGITIEYSDVELGYGGLGNLEEPPHFVGAGTGYLDFALTTLSPCVDAGDPSPLYDDVAFPPSLGSARNDMGANGGPLAGGWLTNW